MPPKSTKPANPVRRQAETGPGGHWVVQVGSFLRADNAHALAKQLESHFKAFVQKTRVAGKTHYRVRIGPFHSEGKARSVAATLHDKGRPARVYERN